MNRKLLALIAIVLGVACSQSASDGPTSSASSSLVLAQTFGPILNLVIAPDWNGNEVELLAADAYYNCTRIIPYDMNGSTTGPVTAHRQFEHRGDRFLEDLMAKMTAAADSAYPVVPPGDLAERWPATRLALGKKNDPNFDEKSVLQSGAPNLATPLVAITLNPSETDIDTDIRTAPFNLCMAAQMRRHMPGSAANQALFLPEAQQRQLLEIVRERSQVSMIQYALLAALTAVDLPVQYDDGLTSLGRWLDNLPDSVRVKMGNDAAFAVQLNTMATEEMAELLARSRSRREPYGVVPATRSDSYWGTSSWYQRELALFYGGDPLAIDVATDAGAPWRGVVSSPGESTTGDGWPDVRKTPAFHTELLEPQPQLLMQMAKQRNLLDLTLQPSTACPTVDVNATALSLYNKVEKAIRDEACETTSGNQCVPSSSLPLGLLDQNYWLLTRYQITRGHALAMVQWLAEALTQPDCTVDPRDGYRGALALGSTRPYDYTKGTQQQVPTAIFTATNIHIAPHATFASRPVASDAGFYSRLTPQVFGDTRAMQTAPSVRVVGFNGSSSQAAESKRLYGAVSAHAAVRRILTSAQALAPNESFVASAANALAVSTSAASGLALSLRPRTTFGESGLVGTGYYDLTLMLDPRTSDVRCDYPANPSGVEQCTLYALYNSPEGSDLTANLNTVIQNQSGMLSATSITYGALYGTGVGIWGGKAVAFDNVNLNFDPSGSKEYTFVLMRQRNSAFYKFDFLAAHVKVRADMTWSSVSAFDGQDLAFNGMLPTIAERQHQPLLRNPVEPAYDGFGWETHWVPPLTAAFIGGDPSQASVNPMLDIAGQSADDAEKAVETAVTGLLDQLRDTTQVSAAQAKSSQAIKQERDGLCGPAATPQDCETAARRTTSNISINDWYGLPGPTTADCSNPSGTQQVMACLLQFALEGIEATRVTLAKPVDDIKTQGNAPSFNQYSGGSLQSALIEQWRAVRALGGKVKAIQDREAAAVQTAVATENQISVINFNVGYKCTVGIALGAVAGLTSGFASATFNPGPMLEAMSACLLAAQGMAAEQAQVISQELDAFAALSASLADVTDFQAALQQSSAKIASLTTQADMASARADLDAKLAASSAVTSFPLYRNFRDADLWRARATVESARRYALAARRAVEARYVVDLTRLDQKETFVAAPSIWADDVYGYDLSLPSSVGLSLPTIEQKDPNAIYKSAIKDYVGNLRGFINGYAALRPSAVAQEDIDVVNLSGFAPVGSAKEAPGAWQLLCGTNWVSLDSYKAAPFGGWNCGIGDKATRARVGFNLDPWGRLNGSIGNEPYTKRYNTRWGKVALNVVGTGVKDCSLAVDPLACYANSTIRYNLTHVTPTWTTDYDGLWREQDMPLGQIEGGKGLAVELFLNPLKDGWNTQFISAVARTEYLFRPVGGSYNLEFEVTPEVVLQRIERMQLLVGTSAWVKQK